MTTNQRRRSAAQLAQLADQDRHTTDLAARMGAAGITSDPIMTLAELLALDIEQRKVVWLTLDRSTKVAIAMERLTEKEVFFDRTDIEVFIAGLDAKAQAAAVEAAARAMAEAELEEATACDDDTDADRCETAAALSVGFSPEYRLMQEMDMAGVLEAGDFEEADMEPETLNTFSITEPIANADGSYDVDVYYKYSFPLVHRLHNAPLPCWDKQTECVQIRVAHAGSVAYWMNVDMDTLANDDRLSVEALEALRAIWHQLFDVNAPVAPAETALEPVADDAPIPITERALGLLPGAHTLDLGALETAYALALRHPEMQTARWQTALRKAWGHLEADKGIVSIGPSGAYIWHPDRDDGGLYAVKPDLCQCTAFRKGDACRHIGAARIISFYVVAEDSDVGTEIDEAFWMIMHEVMQVAA